MSPLQSWLLLVLLALDAVFLAIVIGGTRKHLPRTGPRPVGGSSGLRRGLRTASPTASESDHSRAHPAVDNRLRSVGRGSN